MWLKWAILAKTLNTSTAQCNTCSPTTYRFLPQIWKLKCHGSGSLKTESGSVWVKLVVTAFERIKSSGSVSKADRYRLTTSSAKTDLSSCTHHFKNIWPWSIAIQFMDNAEITLSVKHLIQAFSLKQCNNRLCLGLLQARTTVLITGVATQESVFLWEERVVSVHSVLNSKCGEREYLNLALIWTVAKWKLKLG